MSKDWQYSCCTQLSFHSLKHSTNTNTFCHQTHITVNALPVYHVPSCTLMPIPIWQTQQRCTVYYFLRWYLCITSYHFSGKLEEMHYSQQRWYFRLKIWFLLGIHPRPNKGSSWDSQVCWRGKYPSSFPSSLTFDISIAFSFEPWSTRFERFRRLKHRIYLT